MKLITLHVKVDPDAAQDWLEQHDPQFMKHDEHSGELLCRVFVKSILQSNADWDGVPLEIMAECHTAAEANLRGRLEE